MRKLLSLYFISILLVSMTGCATLPSDPNFYEKQEIALNEIHDFAVSGKIAVRNDGKKLSTYLNIEVQQDLYLLYLTDLTGSTVLRLESRSDGATITDHEGKVYHDQNANKLVKDLTQMDIPCQDLPFILKANPLSYQHELDENHRLLKLYYQNLEIEYRSYTTVGTYVLPDFITIKGDNLLINIRINQWQI